ncbi:MAG: MarR family transcriptional regulator [Comamonas sp.]
MQTNSHAMVDAGTTPTASWLDEGPDVPEPPQARARLGRLIGGVYRQWRRQVDQSVKDLGLTDATRAPLLALHAADGPLRQKELAQALLLETSSLVRVLDQLRAMGLVDWESDPNDRRAKCIALTARGRKTVARILTRSLEIERSILVDVTPEELVVLRSALEKISRRFDTL